MGPRRLNPPSPDPLLQEGKLLDRVYNTYLQMHTHQTVDFVRRKVCAPWGSWGGGGGGG